MCNSRNSAKVTLKNGRVIKVDKCLQEKIQKLQFSKSKIHDPYFMTLGCCCGHGNYSETIICRIRSFRTNEVIIVEAISLKKIPRKKRFYRKDDEGYYFIPEVTNNRIKRDLKIFK